jgi:archaellum biogenesis protein FlaJ (TadC family)
LRRRFFNYVASLPKQLSHPLTTLYSKHSRLEDYVIGSGIGSFEQYVTVTATLTLTAALTTLILASALTYYLSGLIHLSILSGLAISLGAVFPLCYAASLSFVILKYKSRGTVMEAKFPLFTSITSLVFTSEKNISRVFEILNHNYGEILKDFRVELEMITSLIKLNYPVSEALARVAKVTPSPTLKEVLLSLSSSVLIGADPLESMKTITNKYLEKYALKVEKTVNELGTMLEIYLAIALLTPVVMGSLGALLVLSPLGGISFELVIFILSYVVVPASSLASMVLIDATISKVML